MSSYAPKAVFINDSEAETDLLHYSAIAKTILRLIDASGDKPISIGVHGDWGAGKSTVLALIEEHVNQQNKTGEKSGPQPLCLRFNTWQYQGFEDVKSALLEGIITQVRDSRPTMVKVKEQVIETLKQVDYLKLAKKTAQWGLTFYTGIPHPEMVTGAISALKATLSMGRENLTPDSIEKTITDVEDLIKPSAGPKVPEHIEAFKREFHKLLKVAEISKLIVLIDDLDRCLPATVIESMEAMRLFLFTEGTAFVLAADEAMVQYSVKQHFPDLPNSTGPRSYALNYLEKLIQVPFRIPPLGAVEIQHYITLALTEAALGPKHQAFQTLATLAREGSKEPWKTERIKAEAISDALKGHVDDSIKQLILKSDQLHQLLADGTEGNPRQIKRFLNALLLRREIAIARGLEAKIELPVLAKLMLAEYFKDDFYTSLETLVFKHANGAPAELVTLEREAKPINATQNETDDKTTAESIQGSEWKNNEWVQNWAATEPSIAGKDLRPFFFVSRDKKVYFPGMELPNRLASIVDSLMGKTLALMKPAIDKLEPKDAAQVAGEIRNRIIAEGEFADDPKGIVGLLALAEKYQQTRVPLLQLVKNVPVEKVGVWGGRTLQRLMVYPETAAEAKTLTDELIKVNNKIQAFFTVTTRAKK